ncbi:MAG: tetraacyldisaccharide 4'-kinase [Phycisphaerae bacterium]|nr:tetraacyldisaccharide 4'-kinase [Phycisphaerae bacterium]
MNQQFYRHIISGSAKNIFASLIRLSLFLPAVLYSAVIRLRNVLYNKNLLKSFKAAAPVISIGNITAGGTGKTPLVIWLCNYLCRKDYKCAILTRGYKSKKNKYSDEPAALAKNCPSAKVIINPDRCEGAQQAINQYHSQLLVMDDGFQHRRLKRDLDIITVDSTNPFGYGKILPAGLLREPLSALKRANAAILTRCDQVSDSQLHEIEQKLRKHNPDLKIARTIHKPTRVVAFEKGCIQLDQIRNKKIFAFCGIGNPDSFFNTIKTLGCTLTGKRIYNDHHNYTKQDLTDIYEEAIYLQADMILTTHKDWTKITLLPSAEKHPTLACLEVDIDFTQGFDTIKKLIDCCLADKITPA